MWAALLALPYSRPARKGPGRSVYDLQGLLAIPICAARLDEMLKGRIMLQQCCPVPGGRGWLWRRVWRSCCGGGQGTAAGNVARPLVQFWLPTAKP